MWKRKYAMQANHSKAKIIRESELKREFAIPVNRSKAKHIIESNVKAQTRYTSESLESDGGLRNKRSIITFITMCGSFGFIGPHILTQLYTGLGVDRSRLESVLSPPLLCLRRRRS